MLSQWAKLSLASAEVPPLVGLPSKDGGGTIGGYGVIWSIYDPIVRAPFFLRRNGQAWRAGRQEWGSLSHGRSLPDFTRVTFKIRKGVPFHHGWGDVTAEDVVWGFNDALKEGTINNGAEQLSPGLREGWELVDQDHAAMNIRPGGFNPMWLVLHSNVNEDGTFGIVSKKAYDELGEEKFIPAEIGTGPFTTKYWRAEDEVLAEAVPNHWRVTPGVRRCVSSR